MGNKDSILKADWPKYDESLLIEENITVVIQVNGKHRGTIVVGKDLAQEELKQRCLNEPGIKKWIEDKSAKKIIVVPGKLVNIVV